MVCDHLNSRWGLRDLIGKTYALIGSLLGLIAAAKASICLIPLSVIFGTPRTVSVFVPLIVALLS